MNYSLLALALAPIVTFGQDFRPLLDSELSNWEAYLGVPHETVVIAGESQDRDEPRKALGLENDPLQVFTMIEEEGEPVLHISGQIFGGLVTKEEFGNYHLKADFKWGEKKWEPRLTRRRDSGILLHSSGPHGALLRTWKRCLECQIQEHDCGDFIPLGGPSASVPVLESKGDGSKPRYSREGILTKSTGYTEHGGAKDGLESNERPQGEWNTVDIYALGDRVVYAINGEPNMALFDTSEDGPGGEGRVPLVKGQIQLQSEGAELFYRRVEIRPLAEFPASIKPFATRPEGEAVKWEAGEKK